MNFTGRQSLAHCKGEKDPLSVSTSIPTGSNSALKGTKIDSLEREMKNVMTMISGPLKLSLTQQNLIF